MSAHYYHKCPYCDTKFVVTQLHKEKAVVECPLCAQAIIAENYGISIRKPYIYICPKCGHEQIRIDRTAIIVCSECGATYVTSAYGSGLIDVNLLYRGDNGELPYTKKKDHYVSAINKWLLLPKTIKVGIFSAIIVCIAWLVGMYIHSLPPAIETSMAYANMDSLWNEFSEKNPYNIQIECIKNYSDNSRVIIISEPSDFVTKNELVDFFQPYNSFVKTYKRKIGFDGWMRDFVVALNDLKEEEYQSFTRDLAKLLYQTDYKASLVDVSTMLEHTPYLNQELNYNITSEELREWFIEDSESIIPLEGNVDSVTTIAEVLNNDIVDGMQLYISSKPGFVFWAIDKLKSPNELTYRINARKFSLDSDVILGAISKNNNVVIVARERCVPITQLPPMRSETLCLLSSTNDESLSQSYERWNLFAGKQVDSLSGKDYAPIFLSDALWHTEYGSILNVTDQMLKSWSENGTIDYIDFNYPKPVYWAFDKGVLRDLGVNLLTYNWNTEGCGYIVEDSVYSIYALNRTGSLPVSYIAGDTTFTTERNPIYKAEQKAYDFFSTLSNPELAKVVQYTAMYQIFQNFGIHMHYNYHPYYEDVKYIMPRELKLEAINILCKIGTLDSADRAKLAASYNVICNPSRRGQSNYIVSNNKEVCKANDIFGLFSYYFLDSVNHSDLLKFYQALKFIPQIDTLHDYLNPVIHDDIFIESLALAMIDRKAKNNIEYTSYPLTPQVIKIAGVHVRMKSHEERVKEAISAVFQKQDYVKQFARICGTYNCNDAKMLLVAANADRNRTWIKTPTVVESWSLVDSVAQEGGHNLDSKVTRFRVSDKLEPGQVREINVGNKKIIEVSPADSKSHITDQSYLRRVERLDDAKIKGHGIKTRPRNIVTDVVSKRSGRGFNTADHCITIGKKSFTMADKEYSRLDDLLCDLGAKGVSEDVVYIQIKTSEGAGVTPSMVIKYMDNFYRGNLHRGNTMLPMSKYDFSHATQVSNGDYITYAIPIKSGKVDMGSTSNISVAGLGGSANMSPRMNVIEGQYSFKVASKVHTNQIMNILKQFFRNTRGYFNEYKLKMLLKQSGVELIDPTLEIKGNKVESKEQLNLMIALLENNCRYDIQFIQKETA